MGSEQDSWNRSAAVFACSLAGERVILDVMCVCFCCSAKLLYQLHLGEEQGAVTNSMEGIIHLTWKRLDLSALVQKMNDWKMESVNKLSDF